MTRKADATPPIEATVTINAGSLATTYRDAIQVIRWRSIKLRLNGLIQVNDDESQTHYCVLEAVRSAGATMSLNSSPGEGVICAEE